MSYCSSRICFSCFCMGLPIVSHRRVLCHLRLIDHSIMVRIWSIPLFRVLDSLISLNLYRLIQSCPWVIIFKTRASCHHANTSFNMFTSISLDMPMIIAHTTSLSTHTHYNIACTNNIIVTFNFVVSTILLWMCQ